MKTLTRRLALVCIAAALPLAAVAQAWPDKPVRLIVPTPPGNALDIYARLLADGLAKEWKQGVVVENKAGGAGIPGMLAAKTAAPDGYSILIAPSSTVAINPGLYPKLPYDPLKDFDSVAGIFNSPIMLVASAKSPYMNFKDVVAAVKKDPGKVAVAIGGPQGTTQHLATELFRYRAGLEIIPVPYKGSAPAMQDTVGGQVGLLFDSVASSLPQLKAGTIRPIAVATLKRVPQLPDVPTIAELGYPGFEALSWGGLMVPKGTPPAIIARIAADAAKVSADPAVVQQMLSRGLVPDPRNAQEFAAFVDAEIRKWGSLIRTANIKPE